MSQKLSAQERFTQFHTRNPHVLSRVIELTQEFKRRGAERLSMSMLLCYVRMETWLVANTTEPFKVNNDFSPYYTRLLIKAYPQFEDLFETRKLTRGEMSAEEYEAAQELQDFFESYQDE